MLLGLLCYVDLLVAVLGSAYHLDDRHRCSVYVVYRLYFIHHRLEDLLYLRKEGDLVHLLVLIVGDGHDVDVRFRQAERGAE